MNDINIQFKLNTMSKEFTCQNCQKRFTKNPRLKIAQHYCGSRECQQARKNSWEKEKLQNDPFYKAHRVASRKKSYSKGRGSIYQKTYRQTHPDYNTDNNQKQLFRNKKRIKLKELKKIVNTDALIAESKSPQGLYLLIPYPCTDAKKIVNTDALVVKMLTATGLQWNYDKTGG